MIRWQPAAVYEPPPIAVGVDAHVHLFPDELFAAISRWFAAAGWELPYQTRTADILRTLSLLGVREFWALPYAHKPGIADALNEYIAGQQRDDPRVIGFFTVHPADENPAATARRALDELGLHGLKLHAEVQGMALDDVRLDGVFALLEARGVPCILHAGNAPYPEKIERLDVAHLAGRLARNPRLKAVIAHLGAPQTADYLELMDRYSELRLEVSFAHVPPWYEQPPAMLARLGRYADRLLFGSDFPYVTFPYAWQVRSWLRVDWVRERADDFFGGNARRLLAK
ncbi:MAG: amidohydrolase [Myxococcales bacterium]|nr:amidohydrolase [Myxococcales bacterium]